MRRCGSALYSITRMQAHSSWSCTIHQCKLSTDSSRCCCHPPTTRRRPGLERTKHSWMSSPILLSNRRGTRMEPSLFTIKSTLQRKFRATQSAYSRSTRSTRPCCQNRKTTSKRMVRVGRSLQFLASLSSAKSYSTIRMEIRASTRALASI